MTDREKLVAVLNEIEDEHGFICDSCIEAQKSFCIENFADHLIANGVTVNEWISVEDDKPKPFVSVLVYMPGELPFPTVREGYLSSDGTWVSGFFKRGPGEVVKWLPLPEAPKEE